MIEERDPPMAGHREGVVGCGRDAAVRRVAAHPNASRVERFEAIEHGEGLGRRGPVVDDAELPPVVGLSDDRFDRGGQGVGGGVPGRQEDRERRVGAVALDRHPPPVVVEVRGVQLTPTAVVIGHPLRMERGFTVQEVAGDRQGFEPLDAFVGGGQGAAESGRGGLGGPGAPGDVGVGCAQRASGVRRCCTHGRRQRIVVSGVEADATQRRGQCRAGAIGSEGRCRVAEPVGRLPPRVVVVEQPIREVELVGVRGGADERSGAPEIEIADRPGRGDEGESHRRQLGEAGRHRLALGAGAPCESRSEERRQAIVAACLGGPVPGARPQGGHRVLADGRHLGGAKPKRVKRGQQTLGGRGIGRPRFDAPQPGDRDASAIAQGPWSGMLDRRRDERNRCGRAEIGHIGGHVWPGGDHQIAAFDEPCVAGSLRRLECGDAGPFAPTPLGRRSPGAGGGHCVEVQDQRTLALAGGVRDPAGYGQAREPHGADVAGDVAGCRHSAGRGDPERVEPPGSARPDGGLEHGERYLEAERDHVGQPARDLAVARGGTPRARQGVVHHEDRARRAGHREIVVRG
ncbi:MAG: hypothetical protein V9E99_12130 [Microthrixaceae bacterium]